MNVQEIFALRKQGKVEEAYEAIRPIYKEHKGRFTTLCMFWTACDVFKLRLEQKRVEEAVKIYEALKRLLPRIEEIEASDDQAASKREESQTGLGNPEVTEQVHQEVKVHHKGQARGFMKFAEGRLIKESERFRKRYFAMRDKKRGKAKDSPFITSPSSVIPSASIVIPSVVEGSLHKVEMTNTGNDEGINFPSNNPSEDPIIPSETSVSIPCVHPVIPSIVEGSLSKGQQAVLDCIKAHPGLKVPGIETETGIPAKSIERHIKVLIERNLIEHRGSKKTGGYHALDSTFGRLLP